MKTGQQWDRTCGKRRRGEREGGEKWRKGEGREREERRKGERREGKREGEEGRREGRRGESERSCRRNTGGTVLSPKQENLLFAPNMRPDLVNGVSLGGTVSENLLQ